MTHIEQMIQDLCPNGVEWKKLGEVTYWDKRFNEVERSMQPQIRKYHYYLASELEDLESPTGTIKILYTSNKIAYAEEDSVSENVVNAEVVAIPWGGNANIKYFKGKFVTADNRIAVVRDPSILSTKFVYYWLMKNQAEIDSYYRGAGIKHPSMLKVLSFPIPLPPIEIQKKIVECLDKFSALAAELQAELQKRRTQYEYYRTRLLTPPQTISPEGSTDDRNWTWKTLGEICDLVKERVSAAELNENNYVGVENLLSNKQGKIPSVSVPATGNVIKFSKDNILIGNIRPYLRKIWFADCDGGTNGDVITLEIKDKYQNIILPKFLYHALADERFFIYDTQYSSGAKMPRGDKDKVMEYKIPLPSLAEQARIVAILDKFEALTTSLSDGIPAEQAAQQKRYEYYRDKLLTFDRKDV